MKTENNKGTSEMTYLEELQLLWPDIDIRQRYPTLCNNAYHKIHTLGNAVQEIKLGYSNLAVMLNLDEYEKRYKGENK